jgi:hypothetical protein
MTAELDRGGPLFSHCLIVPDERSRQRRRLSLPPAAGKNSHLGQIFFGMGMRRRDAVPFWRRE